MVVVLVCQWNPWCGTHGVATQMAKMHRDLHPVLCKDHPHCIQYPQSATDHKFFELKQVETGITNIVCQSLLVRQVNKDMIQQVCAKSLHSFHHRSLFAYNLTHGRPCRESQESSFQSCHHSMARNSLANLGSCNSSDLETH